MTATATVRPTRLLALQTWILKHKVLIAFCALVGAYYLWTAWSSGSPIAFNENRDDYFNQLSDALLNGQLHLLKAPDADLLALPNPYDPSVNDTFGREIHDLSLYHDKFYLYWGPTPALLLYIPFRLLPLGDLPQTLAVFIFAFVGFCFSIACLRALAQRFVPDAPRWMLGASAVALAFGNALPFTLRRIEMYEVAITAGLCLSFIALYLVITGLRDGVRLGRLGAASLLIGLAVGARPTMIVWALGLVVVAAVLYRRMPDRQTRLRMVGVLLGPVVAIGVLLMLYNVARFGSPTDFGQKYMLAGYDPATRDGNKLAYIPPGMWYYLFARPYMTLGFPFIYLPQAPSSYPLTAPPQYDGVEPIGGMLPSAPFVVFALIAPLVLRGMARRVALGLAAVGLLIIVMASFALWGATMRYEVDFASVLLIVAALGWLGLAVRLSGGLRRRLLAGSGVLLITWTVACGAAFGVMGYWHALRIFSPKTFTHLQNLTSPLPTLVSAIGGEPKTLDIYPPANVESNSDPNGGVGWVTLVLTKDPVSAVAGGPPRLDALQQPPVLTVASGSKRRYGLQLTAAPPQPPPRGTVVTIRMPDTGESLRIPTTAPPTIYPISLRRGLNRIEFRVTGPRGAFARLADIHIVPLPDTAP